MENPRNVATYRHKPFEKMTASDINNGVRELINIAKKEGYESVTDIDVQETMLDGAPATEFKGRPY
jgi:hypothetical protein